ncbi:hypothetical protein BC332_13569 [Capsicum chinense]|nr:hypothetical protein BC332_13569 [Capsicum chinense]
MLNRTEVFSHLLQKGFSEKYTCWFMHGEKHVVSNVASTSRLQSESVRKYPMQDMLNDAFGVFDDNNFQDSGPLNLSDNDHPWGAKGQSQEERDKIKEELEDGNQQLYNGCEK